MEMHMQRLADEREQGARNGLEELWRLLAGEWSRSRQDKFCVSD